MRIESDKDLRGMRRIGEICGLTLKLMLDSAERSQPRGAKQTSSPDPGNSP